jgi:hypothetical protein
MKVRKSIGQLTDEINLWVLTRIRLSRASPELVALYRGALSREPDPDDLRLYFRALSGAWSLLFWLAALVMVALAFIGDQIGGSGGSLRGLALGLFPMAFCLTGELDAAWRFHCAKRAQRALTEGSREQLVRLARKTFGGVVLQLLAGLLATLIALAVW